MESLQIFSCLGEFVQGFLSTPCVRRNMLAVIRDEDLTS